MTITIDLDSMRLVFGEDEPEPECSDEFQDRMICDGCGKPITEVVISYRGKLWHQACADLEARKIKP